MRINHSLSLLVTTTALVISACSDSRNANEAPSDGKPLTSVVSQDEPSDEMSPADVVHLTEGQLVSYSTAALKGDAEAAFSVLMHYQMAMLDRRNAEYWAQIAAENGHAGGISAYIYYLLDMPSPDGCHRARFWVGRARQINENQDEPSVQRLQEDVDQKCASFD